VGTPGTPRRSRSAATTDIGPSTDVFAFAAIAFYLLAGEEYFKGDNPSSSSARS